MARDLSAQLAAGTLDPVYILSSQQPLLIQRAVAAIQDAAVPESLRAFNYNAFEGRQITASAIVTASQTLPMMSDRRLVYVRDLAVLPAAELNKLAPYLKDPNPQTVLLCVVSKLDKRIKLFQAAKKAKVLWELDAPRNLASWLRAEAKRSGIAISAAAGKRLCDVVGKDLSRLDIALQQLSLYTEGKEITTDDVDDLIAHTRERSVFELTDALGEGDLVRARRAVASLCDQRQSAIGVVVMLARHMRQLGLCQVAQQRRLSPGDRARLVGAPPFVVDKLSRQARAYTPQQITGAIAQLSHLDAAFKGMRPATKVLGRELSERVLLEQIVDELVTARESS